MGIVNVLVIDNNRGNDRVKDVTALWEENAEQEVTMRLWHRRALREKVVAERNRPVRSHTSKEKRHVNRAVRRLHQ